MKYGDDDFSAKQENNILNIVYSSLDAYYNTPLKSKISMLVQNTLHHTPIIKGIDITNLERDIKSCIARIDILESDLATEKCNLLVLNNQLMELQNESTGTVLGKLVVLKAED